MSINLPKIFIASSAERLDLAYTMQEHMEYVAEPTVWTQDIFKPNSYALVDLLAATREFQFAIFIFAGDDVLTMKGTRSRAVRDNIIFEFGLFVGALTLPCCFFVVPRSAEQLHLPTDLLGLTPLTYATDRSDGNLVAALGPAANRVRRSIRAYLSALEASEAGVGSDEADPASGRRHSFRRLTTQDLVEIWNSHEFASVREAIRELPSNPYGYDEEELAAHKSLRRIFAFLEAMADAVISGEADEIAARNAFERPVRMLWPHMYTLLAPVNHADEWWKPLPKLAELHARWVGSETAG